MAVEEHPPVALILCGKSPLMAQNFMKELNGPQYEVIHACHTLATAKAEIPALLTHHAISPSSALPTLTASIGRPPISRAPRVPKAIVVGKGFSEAETAELMAAVRGAVPADAAAKVVWLTPDDDKFTGAMKVKAALSGGAKLPHLVAERVRTCLREGGVVPGWEERVEGGVWGF
ncbi:hypothetical protein MBLNU459_g1978t1 [Dothideomycetes sp. NU459]